MKKLPEWKRKMCEKCHWFEVCPIDQDCQAIIEWEEYIEDVCSDNPDQGDW